MRGLMEVIWGVYLLALGVYDARVKNIQSWMLLVGLGLLGISTCVGTVEVKYVLQGLIVGAIFLFISYISKEKLGRGDVYLITILAMYIGGVNMLITLIVAFGIAALIAMILLLAKLVDRKYELPFIPCLAVAYGNTFSQRYKGTYTVEMAFMMPIILMVITGVVLTSFYFHDKNVLYSRVYEVGTVARQMYRSPDGIDSGQLEMFLQDKCGRSFLLFQAPSCSFEINKEEIIVEAQAVKGQRKLKISQRFPLKDAEGMVRKIKPINGEMREE